MLRTMISNLLIAGLIASFSIAAEEPLKDTAIEDDKRLIADQVCRKNDLLGVKAALQLLSITYNFDEKLMQLNAIRHYEEKKIISASIVIEIQFNADNEVANCNVRLIYTGL